MAQSERSDPVVHVWTYDAQTHPEEHKNMQTLMRHKEPLTALMREHGIERADFTPCLPSVTFIPSRDAPELEYELRFEHGIPYDQYGHIRDAILDITGLFGTSMNPCTPSKRMLLLKEHNLVELGVPHIGQQRAAK